MTTTIQFKRGVQSGLPATALQGEPLWTTDTNKLYVGTGTGRVEVGAGAAYTDEAAQDAVGTILVDTATIDLVYDDATPTITAAVRYQMSLAADGSGLRFQGDEAAPAANRYYGTGTTAGTRGFFPLPVSSKEGVWRFDNVTTMADPGAGKVRLDAVTPASATAIAISRNTDSGTDATNVLKALVAEDQVQLQDQDNAANFVRYRLTGVSINNTTWFRLPVAAISSGGTLPTNNSPLLVSITTSGGGGAGYTDEQAQDAVGGILADTATIDLTYDDITPAITAAARMQMSITADAAGLKLDGDTGSPGVNRYYGTSTGGTKGWHALPTGSYQPLDADLTAIAALTGTNTIYYRSAADTWTAVTIGSGLSFSGGTLNVAGGPFQPLDADLTAIAALAGTNTIYYRSAASTWTAVVVGAGLSFAGGTLSSTVTGISDGDKGDITVSGGGATWTIDPGAVTYAKIQNVSGAPRLLGRSTIGAGPVEEIWNGPALTITDATLSIIFATQAQMEAESGSTVVQPSTVKYSPGVAKGWVKFNGTGTVAINASYNVLSITDNGTGDYSVNWNTDFSSANYAGAVASTQNENFIVEQFADRLRIRTAASGGSVGDSSNVFVVGLGDQ